MAINVIAIIKETLNYVDSRLIGHGSSVSYILYNIIKQGNSGYTQEELRNICLAAVLHDIGAYKTEDINKLIQFETGSIWNHSIYGYLILKYLSPLHEFAPVVLYHHAGLNEMQGATKQHQKLAQMLHIADRIDIADNSNIFGEEDVHNMLENGRGVTFDNEIVDFMFENNRLSNLFCLNADNDTEYRNLLYNSSWNDDELLKIIELAVLSIDFRSPQTVAHTVATTCASASIGRILNLPNEELEALKLGAWLHDIGKTGIPVSILEKNGKLTDKEFEIMRSHIIITNDILNNNVEEKIRKISVRHHEKLDGSGYPNGLSASELDLNQRILAVADVFSALSGVRSYKEAFPKEKVASILLDMGTSNKLDLEIVNIALDNYDALLKDIADNSKPIVELYHKIQNDFLSLKEKYDPEESEF